MTIVAPNYYIMTWIKPVDLNLDLTFLTVYYFKESVVWKLKADGQKKQALQNASEQVRASQASGHHCTWTIFHY